MSVQEDREKSNCTGRGLGLAAAAIGVGVGAALYYFFNKRTENHPDTEGSTQNWQCDDRLLPQQQKDVMRKQAFRERSWSLEECSICFDVILKDQDVMALPCTHLFHSKCIMPWLEQHQTCPNCRKNVD